MMKHTKEDGRSFRFESPPFVLPLLILNKSALHPLTFLYYHMLKLAELSPLAYMSKRRTLV